MKIGLIAAYGKTGRHILNEAKMRNHDVTAIVLNKANLRTDNVDTLEKDLFHLTKEDIAPFDVLINAFAPLDDDAQLFVEAGKHLISLLEGTCKKLFVIGSAGCLYIDEKQTIRLMELDSYPDHLQEIAKYQLANLEDLQKSSINWTFVSPAAIFDYEGPRTGHYILGQENMTFNSQLNNYASYADFAVAVIDEIENNNHVNTFFTVASENVTSAS